MAIVAEVFGRRELCHRPDGAPFIPGSGASISVSHCQTLVVLAADRLGRNIGIDCETASRGAQLGRVARNSFRRPNRLRGEPTKNIFCEPGPFRRHSTRLPAFPDSRWPTFRSRLPLSGRHLEGDAAGWKWSSGETGTASALWNLPDLPEIFRSLWKKMKIFDRGRRCLNVKVVNLERFPSRERRATGESPALK